MRKCKRDIYKSRFDRTFDFEKDIDLADLRQLLTTRNMNDEERNRFGHYVNNVASIILKSSKFCGFPDFVKHDIRSLGAMDVITGYHNFNASLYTAATAPFSYVYRIIYNKATHVCKDYYKNRCVAFSQLPETFARNVAEIKSEDDTEHPTIGSELPDLLTDESAYTPPVDVIRSRIKASVKAVLVRRMQMRLNLV